MLLENNLIRSYSLLELLPFGKSVITICNNRNTANVLQLDEAINGFKTPLADVETAFAYQKDSPQTKELVAIDIRRDRAFNGIKANAHSFSYSNIAANAAASEVIASCIKKYGKKIIDLEYNKESETLDQLIIDFENDTAVVAALATLGLVAWVAELKAANELFKQKYIDRTQQYANQPAQPAYLLRPLAIAGYNNLVLQINSRSVVDGTGKYDVLIGELNALSDQYDANYNRGNSTNNNPPTPVTQ
jgi:hypothetical protein